MKTVLSFMCCALFFTGTFAQTFTMGKKCRAALEAAEQALTTNDFTGANGLYDAFAAKCKTKDAKEAAAVGKAEVFNGLGNYNEALNSSDAALKITKGKSLKAHFQKAVAYNKLGDFEASKTELNEVLRLTENNENVQERAKNYALMSALYERQLTQLDSAQVYLNMAKELDPTNINFLIQEGTMYSSAGDFTKAFESYDQALQMDPNNPELSVARVNTRLRMMENKYGTSKAQDLRTKMTEEELQVLCNDLEQFLALGSKDLNKEMFKALVCN